MARAETIENVGETGGGGSGPLPRHNTCRMELPRPFHTWPNLLANASGAGAIRLHQEQQQIVPPLPAFYLSYPVTYSHPEGPEEPQTQQQVPPLSAPPCDWREESGEGVVGPSASSDSEVEEHQEASSRQGPLPDLLPQNEHPSWASARHRAPRAEAVQELEIRRVANQLRAIGDEFNATVLHRVHVAPQWQDWRDGFRGVLNFITQTLSTLYRLT